MTRYPKKDPRYSLTALLVVGLSAFCCGGGICGLGGLIGPSSPDSGSDPPRASSASSTSTRPLPQTPYQPPGPQPQLPKSETSSTAQSTESLSTSADEVVTNPSAPGRPEAPSIAIASSAVPLRAGESTKRVDPPLRQWTSRDGAFRTAAKFVSVKLGKVRLNKIVRNEFVDVPLQQLSELDRQYVAETVRVDPAAKVIFGEVTNVADGDTVTIVDEEKRQHTIRLQGIDAPEGGQAFGDASKQRLSDKVFGKSTWTEWRELDKYNRTLGHIYLDGRHINLEMVADGLAWHYKEYSSDPRLANAEAIARAKRIGLWSDENKPVAPWDFRHPPPAPAAIQGLLGPASQAGTATVYVTRTGKSYHAAGCRFLAKSSIPIALEDARLRYKACSVCNPPP